MKPRASATNELKRDTLEALADRLFNSCPRLIEDFGEKAGVSLVSNRYGIAGHSGLACGIVVQQGLRVAADHNCYYFSDDNSKAEHRKHKQFPAKIKQSKANTI